jgi:hypothetical protein
MHKKPTNFGKTEEVKWAHLAGNALLTVTAPNLTLEASSALHTHGKLCSRSPNPLKYALTWTHEKKRCNVSVVLHSKLHWLTSCLVSGWPSIVHCFHWFGTRKVTTQDKNNLNKICIFTKSKCPLNLLSHFTPPRVTPTEHCMSVIRDSQCPIIKLQHSECISQT